MVFSNKRANEVFFLFFSNGNHQQTNNALCDPEYSRSNFNKGPKGPPLLTVDQGCNLGFLIGQENTNLVEDLEI